MGLAPPISWRPWSEGTLRKNRCGRERECRLERPATGPGQRAAAPERLWQENPRPERLSLLRPKLGHKTKQEPKFRSYSWYGHVWGTDVLETAGKCMRANSMSHRIWPRRSGDTGPASSCLTRFASPTSPEIRNLFLDLRLPDIGHSVHGNPAGPTTSAAGWADRQKHEARNPKQIPNTKSE